MLIFANTNTNIIAQPITKYLKKNVQGHKTYSVQTMYIFCHNIQILGYNIKKIQPLWFGFIFFWQIWLPIYVGWQEGKIWIQIYIWLKKKSRGEFKYI